jgi:hypothetical protein
MPFVGWSDVLSSTFPYTFQIFKTIFLFPYRFDVVVYLLLYIHSGVLLQQREDISWLH